MKAGYIYILTNKPNGTLYIGVTNDIARRVYEHRSGVVKGYTWKYNLKRLVYVEVYDDIQDARARELQMKEWHRDWKIRLIEKENPGWRDLYDEL